MADNVAITAGSGTIVGTDERTINSVAVHVQRVVDQGASAVASGQTTVTTTSAQKVAARDTRKSVTIRADDANTANVYVGASGVSDTTGYELIPGAEITLETTAAIHCDTTTGTQNIQYEEEYDA